MSPVVKKSARASNSTRSVTVTLIGDGGSPRAVRSSRRVLRAHQQPRVVVAHGRCAHQDRVAGGAHRVDPVEVGVVGQLEAPRRRAAEIAVDRHAAAQQGVGAVRHVRLPPGAAVRSAPRPGTTEPCHHEDGGARQAGDEHHDAVDDGGGDPSLRTQAGRAERPCRHALARAPAADAGQHHGQHHEQRDRQHPRQWRGGARGPRGDQESDRVAGDDQRRRERDAQPRPPGEQPVADVAGRCAPDPRPRGPADRVAPGRRARRRAPPPR